MERAHLGASGNPRFPLRGGRQSASASQLFILWFKALRPEFWLVCIFPLWMGYIVAAREVWPDSHLFTGVAGRALSGGIGLADVLGAAGEWLSRDWWFLYAILCMGPLIWGSTLLFNDYCDIEADRRNPRRARSPHVLGFLSPRDALRGSLVLGATGLVLAWSVSPLFFVLMLACLVLSWAYSAPPLRLKSRAGFDLIVNVLGIGVICTVAGWSLARPLDEFPWPYLIQPVLLLAAAYVPTTMVDYPVDKEQGIDSISVHLGIERAFWLGFAFNLAANVLYLATAYFNYVVSWEVYAVTWPFSVVEVLAYVLFYPTGGRLPPKRALVAIFAAMTPFAIGQLVFVAHYVGYLKL